MSVCIFMTPRLSVFQLCILWCRVYYKNLWYIKSISFNWIFHVNGSLLQVNFGLGNYFWPLSFDLSFSIVWVPLSCPVKGNGDTLVCGNINVSALENAVGSVCWSVEVLELGNAVSQYVTMQTYQHVRMQMHQSILESSFVLMCEWSCVIVWVHRFAVQGNAVKSVCGNAEV